jgi:uncharacterized 2Fe-2S/4Fe-4S cluster protein (DUF4445 family)
MSKTVTIEIEPIGRRVEVQPGTTLMQAAQDAGVEIASICGGGGWCGNCRIKLVLGELTPVTELEYEVLSKEEIENGWRLACQSQPLNHLKIDIPPESLTSLQRVQMEGVEGDFELNPVVIPIELHFEPPTLAHQISDVSRVKTALMERGIRSPQVKFPLLISLSSTLRAQAWQVRLALRGEEVVGVFLPGTPLLGLAVDIGTTKLAAYLVNLENGRTLARVGVTNPQLAYGEDVISRIAYANQSKAGRGVLQARLVERLNELVDELCLQVGTVREQIIEAVMVGNTAMHHLFLGLPVRQLGEAPYIAAVSESVEIRANDLGLHLAPGAYVYMPPNIAGYVGSDHVSMLLATVITGKTSHDGSLTMALDIGTNTEISLVTADRVLSCSCASGPAFEGAHIHDGMRAAPGAIEHLRMVAGDIHVHTIGDGLPVGICGSGILDAIAEMRRVGIIDATGRLQKDAPGVHAGKHGGHFVLVTASETGHGREIIITRKDIHEIQLAKGAIRAGINALLLEAGINYEDIDKFIVAGAFGTYLDVGNAVNIGMFPPLPLKRFKQVGNAAGIGAKQLLLSVARRREAPEIIKRVEYVELTTHPLFTEIYIKALLF